jgi:hypothetical protein
VTVDSRRWTLEVYSIVDRFGVRWIQLALNGPRRHALTMRLKAGTGVPHVMRALAAWLTGDPGSGQVVNVASDSSLRITPRRAPAQVVIH